MKKFVFFTLYAIFLSLNLNAQFVLNSEIRPRGEIRNGYKSLFSDEDNTAYFVSQRTRLGASYTTDNYILKITGQDVRVWGDESWYSSTGIKGDASSIDLYEAWFQINLSANSSLKIGRQEWKYDNQRLLSNRNWGQSGMAYDGLLYNFDNKDLRVNIGLSLNNDAENIAGNEYTPDKIKFLDFIYLNKKLGQKSVITFTGILSGYQKEEGSETVYVTATYGPYFTINHNSFDLEGSFFHQTGTNNKSQNVTAYLFSLSGLYKFSEKFNLGPGIDIISGNDLSNTSNTDRSFDLLYGGRHRFSGEMDLFTNLSKNTLDAGLIDIFAKTNLSFNKKNSLTFAYHYFSTQKRIPDPNNNTKNLEKSLGSEFDLMYRYKTDMPLELRLGFILYDSTKIMDIIQGINGEGSSLQYFTYLQLSFTPDLFVSDK